VKRIIRVITGATGTLTIGLKKKGNNTRKESIQYILYKKKKKTSLLGASYIARKVLQYETGSLGGGVHHWFKRRSTRGEDTYVKRQ
jgi:hypothetical protein